MKIHITAETDGHPVAEALGANGNKIGIAKTRAWLTKVIEKMAGGHSPEFGHVGVRLAESETEGLEKAHAMAVGDREWAIAATIAEELQDLEAIRKAFRGMGTDDAMTADDHDPVPHS